MDDPNPVTVNISASPCADAEQLGYDERQINRIMIRIARFFLFKGKLRRASPSRGDIRADSSRGPLRGAMGAAPTLGGDARPGMPNLSRRDVGLLRPLCRRCADSVFAAQHGRPLYLIGIGGFGGATGRV